MKTTAEPTLDELVGLMAPEKPGWNSRFENHAMSCVGQVATALNLVFGSRAGHKPGILTYHRIAPRIAGCPFPTHNVTPSRFESQLRGLLHRGYTVRPLRDVLDWHAEGTEPTPRTVVITFDDGFESVYDSAWPVLRDLNLPATIFVNTAFLDGDRPFPFDHWAFEHEGELPPKTFRPLTSDQCLEMQASGLIDIGAHTHTHQDFRGRETDFEQDLQRNLDELATRFDVDRATFAYPVGSPHRGFAGGGLLEAVRRTSVRCALTTESVLVDIRRNPFEWGRFNVFPWDTAATLAAKLNGWYSWAPTAKRRSSAVLRQFLRRLYGN